MAEKMTNTSPEVEQQSVEYVFQDEAKHLEPPVRVFNNHGRYFLSFTSQEAAEKFVVAFWEQVDAVQQTPEHARAINYFKSGMWHPDQELGKSCRTGIMKPITAHQKEGGITAMVYINGNTGSLQPWGVEALKKLVDLKD